MLLLQASLIYKAAQKVGERFSDLYVAKLLQEKLEEDNVPMAVEKLAKPGATYNPNKSRHIDAMMACLHMEFGPGEALYSLLGPELYLTPDEIRWLGKVETNASWSEDETVAGLRFIRNIQFLRFANAKKNAKPQSHNE